MKKLILMIQFLTRIPINIDVGAKEEDFRDGIIYFPLVGLIIGAFASLCYFAAYQIGGRFLASVVAVTAQVFITGGLHLDGLGDTFDGVYSNRPKERILEIMKDSRLGTNAALALLLTILLKIALLNNFNIKIVYSALLLTPVFSRLCIVYASKISVYARENGMGNMFIGKINNRHVAMAIFFGAIISIIYLWALPLLFLSYFFSRYYVNHISSKIGGMTGDTLGALCELSELFFLFYFTIILYLSR